MIIKKSGQKELYQKEKMAAGVRKAFEKRPFEENQIENIIDELDQQVNALAEKELESIKVGEMVLEKIKKIDDVAYLRFASVYKSFDDVEAFRKELNQVKCGQDECEI